MKMCLGATLVAGFLSAVACASTQPGAPAVTVTAVSPAQETRQQWEIEWQKVVEGAKREGEITVTCSLGPDTIREVTNAIRQKYGITMSFTTVPRGAQLAERLFSERRAGIYAVDVIISGATTSINVLKPEGFLQPLEPFIILPEAKAAKAWRGSQLPFTDKQRTLIPLVGGFNRYLMRNTDLVREGEIKSFTELLDSRWKGKMIVNDPTRSGAGNAWVSVLVDNWGLEKTRDYLRQFAKQEPVLTNDIRLQVETVARGKYHLAVAPSTETAMGFIREGAPVAQVATAEGGSMSTSAGVLSLPTKPAHPNGAMLLANWLLTSEGQTVFTKGYGIPASRLDVPPPPGFNPLFLPRPGERVQLETEEDLRMKGTVILDIAREALGPLLR
ncbi:MAG: extracellular solute-binding protein [Chloroflexi bacterium]|nr:extracellular solute-binding protein [Chloroflexota bacterium]